MTVTCPGCGWSAEVPEEKIPDGGITATCRKCQVKFEIKKELKPIAEQPPVSPRSESKDTKPCPLCGEAILTVAKKCKHCNSMLDEVKEEPHPPVQEPSQTAASTEVESEKKEMADHKSSISNERKPLSNLEKVLFVIFGVAIIGGISGNNSAAPAMLLLYIGAIAYRLRKQKSESYSTVVAAPAKNRVKLLLAILGLIVLAMIPKFLMTTPPSQHSPPSAPSTSSAEKEALDVMPPEIAAKVIAKVKSRYPEPLIQESFIRDQIRAYKEFQKLSVAANVPNSVVLGIISKVGEKYPYDFVTQVSQINAFIEVRTYVSSKKSANDVAELRSKAIAAYPEDYVAQLSAIRKAIDPPAEVEVLRCDLDGDRIKGRARNNTSNWLSSLTIYFNLYDANDVVVDSTTAHVSNLEPNGVWDFDERVFKPNVTKVKVTKFAY